MNIVKYGPVLAFIGATAMGVAMGQMVLAGYPWEYPLAVVVGLILITLGNAGMTLERVQTLGALREEVEALRGRIAEQQREGGATAGPVASPAVPQAVPQAPPHAPEAGFSTATEAATVAIAVLFRAWRSMNPKGWWEDFVDDALLPAFIISLRKVDPALRGTQEKVMRSRFGSGDRKP